MPFETYHNLPDHKRERILEVLLDEFSSADYQDVSVDQIVEQAGISKGSFYQYFEDKRDCYLYLLGLVVDEKIRFMSQISQPAADQDLFAVLREILTAGLDFQFSNPRLGLIAYRASMADLPLPEETRALIQSSSLGYFQDLIQQGIENGTLAPDLDPKAGAFILNTVFSNLGEHLLEDFGLDSEKLLQQGASLFKGQDIQQTIHNTLDILEKGFRKGSAGDSSS